MSAIQIPPTPMWTREKTLDILERLEELLCQEDHIHESTIAEPDPLDRSLQYIFRLECKKEKFIWHVRIGAMSGFRRIMRCKTFTSVDHHSNRPPLKWLKVLGLWYGKQWDKIIELHATGKLEDEWWRKTTSENSIDEPGVTRQATIMSYPSHDPPGSRRGYVASAQCKNLVCADDEEIHEPFISGRRSNKSAIDHREGNAQTKTQTGLVY